MTDHDRPTGRKATQSLGYDRGDQDATSYPKPADPKRLLRLDEVAERLNVSITTVRRLVAGDELPVVRVGRAVRVRPADLEDYIRRSLE